MSQINKCDRCGAVIKGKKQMARGIVRKEVYQCTLVLFSKTFQERDTEFDLCPKCLEDFKRFMKGDDSECSNQENSNFSGLQSNTAIGRSKSTVSLPTWTWRR